MKIIITENQRDSIKIELHNIIKYDGWKTASKFVGGTDNLKKLIGIKTPMEFLNLFNDLDVVVNSKENPNWTLYRYEKRNNLIVYDTKNREVFISYEKIWSYLEEGYGLDYNTIKELTHTWLFKEYNLRFFETFLRSNHVFFNLV